MLTYSDNIFLLQEKWSGEYYKAMLSIQV